MINTARLHSDLSRLNRETAMMSATIETLSSEEMAAASLCEGWSRAQVIAHLASNGRSLVKLIDWATSGEPQELYASREARDAEIDELAALPRE
ncbi:maleylpyruvate isomerase family mycothiol-dependent enzyme [Glutamicibacter sp. AGC46]